MWGGRFAAQPADAMQAINASIDVDKRLWREDIEGSKAHADMLAAQGIITARRQRRDTSRAGPDRRGNRRRARFPFSAELEDIHLNIEARLTERIGEAGKRLHTGRSRNDQVATDFKLWTMRAAREAADGLRALQKAAASSARRARRLDHAGLHAFADGAADHAGPPPACLRDDVRARPRAHHRRRAGGGVGMPAGRRGAGRHQLQDRSRQRRRMRWAFMRRPRNSLDAVGSRDFALAALANLAIAATHLSRLAEEIVLWTQPAIRLRHA